MCHQTILGFRKCGHSTSIASICERNGEIMFQPCPQGWSGELKLDDGYCLGCQSTLDLPGVTHEQALYSIKTRPEKMPFSYVAYGLVPRSAEHCADLVKRESMLLLWPPDHDDQPVEWLSLPPLPPWEREQAASKPTDSPYQWKDDSFSPFTATSAAPVCDEAQFDTQKPDHPPSALKKKTGSLMERYHNETRRKKSVRFFEESHVQYFFKDKQPSSVSNHSVGMHQYCAVENVIWGPKPSPYWNGPSEQKHNDNVPSPPSRW